MGVPGQVNVSQTARLILAAPSYAIGWQELIKVPNPAAGQVWAHKVDGRYYERVVAAMFTLTTSAVVANRFPTFYLIDNNGTIVTEVPAGGTITANSQVTAVLHLGGPAYSFGTTGNSYGFLPDILAAPDWSWGVSVSGIDAGDTLTNGSLLVHRFPNDIEAISAGE